MISNDAVVFGILMVVLGFVFYTSNLRSSFWKKFYTFFPVILLCYLFNAIFFSQLHKKEGSVVGTVLGSIW